MDVSRAFDRVFHEGLLFKLRQLGIGGPFLKWLQSYLSNRKQRVVINGTCSDWGSTEAGVPQGSILGPLLFLNFINDIANDILTLIYLFADDTSLLEIIDDIKESFSRLNNDLAQLQRWSEQWLVTFNPTKTVFTYITLKKTKPDLPNLFLSNTPVNQVSSHIHLGLTLSNNMSWENHVTSIAVKANKRVTLLKRIKRMVPRSCLETLYTSMIRPVLEYACIIFDNCTLQQSKMLERVQREAAIVCTGAYRRTHHDTLLRELGWPTLADRRLCQKLCLFYKMCHQLVPTYLSKLCPLQVSQVSNYNLRNSQDLVSKMSRLVCYQNSVVPSAIREWNKLPVGVRNSLSLQGFKTSVKKELYPLKTRRYSTCTGQMGINHGRLRMGLSALNAQRFQYNLITFKNCLLCPAPKEDVVHYFLKCPCYFTQRVTLLKNMCELLAPGTHYSLLPQLDEKYFCQILLCGSDDYDAAINSQIFSHVQRFIDSTARF